MTISNENKKNISNKISNIEGQVAGLKKMLITDRECDEILNQIITLKKGLNQVANEVVSSFMHDYYMDEFQTGIKEPFEKFEKTLKLLAKM